jgi:hypothetical protein
MLAAGVLVVALAWYAHRGYPGRKARSAGRFVPAAGRPEGTPSRWNEPEERGDDRTP